MAMYVHFKQSFSSICACLVDEEEDAEVDAIMQQHSGDVKFVCWHPDDDASFSRVMFPFSICSIAVSRLWRL